MKKNNHNATTENPQEELNVEQFYEKFKTVLSNNANYVNQDGSLNRVKLENDALKYEIELISILLNAQQITEKFFVKIQGIYVFKQQEFLDYIRDKNVLNGSYTKYRNKIGLVSNEQFIRTSKNVVLDFPFKDCILEGGQSRGESKRKEIMFNTVLAKDEIDKLLDAKVLTNQRRITTSGEVVVNKIKMESLAIKENVLIKGNNLLALHTIKSLFAKQVKLIYIDPPYNTGNDEFRYNDNFNHSTWLTFMKNRLEVARELLKDDGVIFVQCDDNEQAYLKVLMDEIFGRDNFVSNIIWEKNFAPKNNSKYLSDSHDIIIVYAKSKEKLNINLLPMTDIQKGRYKNPDNDPRGAWTSGDLSSIGTSNIYEITLPNGKKLLPPSGRSWVYSKEKLKELIKDNRIYFASDGDGIPRYKRFISEIQQGMVARTIFYNKDCNHTQGARQELKQLFNDEDLFSTPKPEALLKRIIELTTVEGDIVLDFFAGSGTTAAVAHKMNRQWISIEQMDYIETITLERLKKVVGQKSTHNSGNLLGEEEIIEYDKGGISNAVNYQGGGDFLYFELKKLNLSLIEEIEQAQTSEDLLSIKEKIITSSFVNYNVDVKELMEDKDNLFANLDSDKNENLKKQKAILMDILDKNQLYVNFSERKDKLFNCSDDEIEFSEFLNQANPFVKY